MAVFVGDLWNTMEKTLNSIAQDVSDSDPKKEFMRRIFDEDTSMKAFETDLEMGGPGLASLKPEGEEMTTGDLTEGTLTRYMHRTYALRLIISEEAMEDTQYKQVLQLGRRLKRAAKKTVEYDAGLFMARGFNTSYPLADGQPLWSASHTLPAGGTYSTLLSTATAASLAGLIEMETEVRRQVDHQGLIAGLMIEAVMCPVDQWPVWCGILNSAYNPEPGQFNEINVVKKDMSVKEAIATPFWTGTSTNWAVKTDAEQGFKWFWRRKMQNRTWVENSQMFAHYAITYRSSRGVTDARCTYGSQA